MRVRCSIERVSPEASSASPSRRLEEVADAHRRIEAGHNIGRVVLAI
jgi:hypothetical protein